MEQSVFVWMAPTTNGKGHPGKLALRLTSERPAGNRTWFNKGNVYIELIDNDVLKVLQKLDARTSPLKNEELLAVMAELISSRRDWTPSK